MPFCPQRKNFTMNAITQLVVVSYPLDPEAFFMAGVGAAHIEARHAQYDCFEKFLTGMLGKG